MAYHTYEQLVKLGRDIKEVAVETHSTTEYHAMVSAYEKGAQNTE